MFQKWKRTVNKITKKVDKVELENVENLGGIVELLSQIFPLHLETSVL